MNREVMMKSLIVRFFTLFLVVLIPTTGMRADTVGQKVHRSVQKVINRVKGKAAQSSAPQTETTQAPSAPSAAPTPETPTTQDSSTNKNIPVTPVAKEAQGRNPFFKSIFSFCDNHKGKLGIGVGIVAVIGLLIKKLLSNGTQAPQQPITIPQQPTTETISPEARPAETTAPGEQPHRGEVLAEDVRRVVNKNKNREPDYVSDGEDDWEDMPSEDTTSVDKPLATDDAGLRPPTTKRSLASHRKKSSSASQIFTALLNDPEYREHLSPQATLHPQPEEVPAASAVGPSDMQGPALDRGVDLVVPVIPQRATKRQKRAALRAVKWPPNK